MNVCANPNITESYKISIFENLDCSFRLCLLYSVVKYINRMKKYPIGHNTFICGYSLQIYITCFYFFRHDCVYLNTTITRGKDNYLFPMIITFLRHMEI